MTVIMAEVKYKTDEALYTNTHTVFPSSSPFFSSQQTDGVLINSCVRGFVTS